MKKLFTAVVSAAMLVTFSSGMSYAEDPKLLGTYGDWSSYLYTESGHKVCYMASTPTKAVGNYTRRGDVIVFITHRPAEGTKDEFSYMTGYPYKESSSASVKVAGKTFTLFTQEETAWTTDSQTDRNLIAAIRKGSKMTVKGRSKRGTLTTDTFSLKGSSAAHEAITKECY